MFLLGSKLPTAHGLHRKCLFSGPDVIEGTCDVTLYPDRAPLKEVLGGQYNYREGGRQVLRQGAKGRRRNRKWQCSKDPCAQKLEWRAHGSKPKVQVEGAWIGH